MPAYDDWNYLDPAKLDAARREIESRNAYLESVGASSTGFNTGPTARIRMYYDLNSGMLRVVHEALIN